MLGKNQVGVCNFVFEVPESHRGRRQAEEGEIEQSPEEPRASCQVCAKYANTYIHKLHRQSNRSCDVDPERGLSFPHTLSARSAVSALLPAPGGAAGKKEDDRCFHWRFSTGFGRTGFFRVGFFFQLLLF